MSKYAFVVLILSYLLIGCKDEAQPAIEEPQTEALIAEAGFEANDDVSQGVYKRYTGTVAGMPVVVNITDINDKLKGEYYYEKIGVPITIYGVHKEEAAENEYLINEYPPERNEEQDTWRITVSGDSITGVWISGDSTKEYPVVLKESYTNDMMRFSIVSVVESLPYHDSLTEPEAEFEYTVLLPVGFDADAVFVTSVISTLINCDTNAKDLDDCIEQKKVAFHKTYRESLEGLKDDMLESPTNNWNESVGVSVSYNANNIVVLNKSHYEYSGGAHGNFSEEYLNVDVKHKKVMNLSDMMTVDTVKLVKLITPQLRKRFGIKKGQRLTSYLFTDRLYIPDNYYINHKGITFSYGLYEIASYADGIIDVFIPYSKIMDLLHPEFIERMGLEVLVKN